MFAKKYITLPNTGYVFKKEDVLSVTPVFQSGEKFHFDVISINGDFISIRSYLEKPSERRDALEEDNNFIRKKLRQKGFY